jgi:signal peptidase I
MAKRATGGLAETVKTLVYAIVIALFIRTFFYEPFNIPSGSMIPTLLVGDYLFVSKFSYGYSRFSLPFGLPLFSGRLSFHEPERGDVVVFKWPGDTSVDYIKRVIGLPGDTVQVKQGIVYINGEASKREPTDFCRDPEDPRSPVYQHYLETLPGGARHCIVLDPDEGQRYENTEEFKVPAGHYFMMGDNRDHSADSRVPGSQVGDVPAENLVGRAQFLFFSTNGYADWWEIWNWPFSIRYDRLLMAIR